MALEYKQKYLELRAKMMENIDVSYRLGYEKGFTEGQKQAEQEAQAMQQQMMQEQAAMGGGAVDENGQPISPEEQQMMEEQGGEMPQEGEMPEEGMEEQGGGSDLDSHIQELESLVQKGEKPSVLSMRDAVNKLAEIRKSQKERFKRNQPKVVSSQKKFVDGLLKKWEDEANKDKEGNELDKIIKESGIKLGD